MASRTINHKPKILLILGAILAGLLILSVIICIILKFTIWRTPEDPYATLSREEWRDVVSDIKSEARLIEADNEVDQFYQDKIDSLSDLTQRNDLYITYAREVASRGYTYRARQILDSMNVNDFTCSQEYYFYIAYKLTYQIDRDDDKIEEYLEKAKNIYDRCNVEEHVL